MICMWQGLERPCKDCQIWVVHIQGCIGACQHINACCNQQASLGENAFATSSHLWDWVFFQRTRVWWLQWADSEVRSGLWNLGPPQCSLDFPLSSAAASAYSLLCVLGREEQSIQQSPGGLQNWTSHHRLLFCSDPQIFVTLLAFIYFGVE